MAGSILAMIPHGDPVPGVPEAVYRRHCNDRRKIGMEIKMETETDNRDG